MKHFRLHQNGIASSFHEDFIFNGIGWIPKTLRRMLGSLLSKARQGFPFFFFCLLLYQCPGHNTIFRLYVSCYYKNPSLLDWNTHNNTHHKVCSLFLYHTTHWESSIMLSPFDPDIMNLTFAIVTERLTVYPFGKKYVEGYTSPCTHSEMS